MLNFFSGSWQGPLYRLDRLLLLCEVLRFHHPGIDLVVRGDFLLFGPRSIFVLSYLNLHQLLQILNFFQQVSLLLSVFLLFLFQTILQLIVLLFNPLILQLLLFKLGDYVCLFLIQFFVLLPKDPLFFLEVVKFQLVLLVLLKQCLVILLMLLLSLQLLRQCLVVLL